jgi:uncharacterized protein (DUF488 family)
MSQKINLHTIGFTKKTAKNFFELLMSAGVKTVIDVRLNNVSQLAGFSKKPDLEYFLKAIGGIEYIHRVDLAPTQDILDQYKKQKGDWNTYEELFLSLMEKRQIETKIDPKILENACLLCSEPTAHQCHRRLVAEYLQGKLGNLKINHL